MQCMRNIYHPSPVANCRLSTRIRELVTITNKHTNTQTARMPYTRIVSLNAYSCFAVPLCALLLRRQSATKRPRRWWFLGRKMFRERERVLCLRYQREYCANSILMPTMHKPFEESRIEVERRWWRRHQYLWGPPECVCMLVSQCLSVSTPGAGEWSIPEPSQPSQRRFQAHAPGTTHNAC